MTTKGNPSDPTGEHTLARHFNVVRPNQKWLVDIAYVTTDEGKLYLPGILDRFSRNLVG